MTEAFWESVNQWDRYGGSMFRSYEATGFFRLEHDNRWWLVSPEGHPFISFGLNHVEPDEMLRPYNRRYWSAMLGCDASRDNPAFMAAYEEEVRLDFARFGMNTLACHSNVGHYASWKVPYVHTLRVVDICHWQTPTAVDFLDVFSDAFAERCRAFAAEDAAPRANDPYLIGYSYTDCPILTPLEAAQRTVVMYGGARVETPTWPNVLRNLGAEDAGKRAYVDLMREVYAEDIGAFNTAYGQRFEGFGELLATPNWCPAVATFDKTRMRDYYMFLERIVDRYYAVLNAAIREADPNHLIVGDKMNGNTDLPDEIMALVGKHMDVVFFQWYADYDRQKETLNRWSRLTNKPLFNGDSSFSVPTRHTPDSLGPHCGSHEERALRATAYAEKAFARPDFIGWNWCGWMDRWAGYGRDARHTGLQDPFGNVYVPMQVAMLDISSRMYGIALGKPSGQRQG